SCLAVASPPTGGQPARSDRQTREAAEQLHLLRDRHAVQLEIRKASQRPLERALGVLLREERTDATMTKTEAQVARIVLATNVEHGRFAGIEAAAAYRAPPIELVDGNCDRLPSFDRQRIARGVGTPFNGHRRLEANVE